MNLLAIIRRRKKVWIRRLAAPMAAAWLAMAWQPCATAMDAETGHEHRCAQCPPPEIEHCDDVVRQDCSDGDRFSADLRAAKAKSADDTKLSQVFLAVTGQPHRLPVLETQRCLTHPATAPPIRSLPILFCTYLK